MKKNFALIGSAGYIAERHMKAIKETGNELVACLDKFDVMGKIDTYFPLSEFFLEEFNFWKHLSEIEGSKKAVDYVVICTPNNLHFYFIIQAFSRGYSVICEKPMVRNSSEAESLKIMAKQYNKMAFGILQLRLHPVIKKLKANFAPTSKKTRVSLEYFTPRGSWYHQSWKTKEHLSGGLAMNIGIHFFDMLIWIFGEVKKVKVKYHTKTTQKGTIELEFAVVSYHLSINTSNEPKRRIMVTYSGEDKFAFDSVDLEFTQGFTDLHTESYRQILNGNGFTIHDTEESIKLAEQIRILTK